MEIQITLAGKTLAEIVAKMEVFVMEAKLSAAENTVNKDEAASAQMEMKFSEPVARAKRGPKAKSAAPVVEAVEAPAVETLPIPQSNEGKLSATKDEAVAHLQQVNNQKGLKTAREVLAKFNCARISELKEEDFNGFVLECQAQLAKA